MAEEMKPTEVYEKAERAAQLLLATNMCVRPEVAYEVDSGIRLLTPGQQYAEIPFADIAAEELDAFQSRFDRRLTQNVAEQIREYGDVSVSMFTCLNGDATQIRTKPEAYIPREFDEDQVFFQRMRILFWLLGSFRDIGVPLNISLLLGDSDLLVYYMPILESNDIDVDLQKFTGNIESFRESLALFLRYNAGKLGDLADVWTYGNDPISLSETRGLSRNGISIVSLVLNTSMWEYPDVGNLDIDPADYEDCFRDLRVWMENRQRFDASVFSNCPDLLLRDVVLGKFGTYRDQGEYVESGGGIILMDELPPQWKCRMLTAKSKNLLFLFPWIRSEDPWRNPRTIPGGDQYETYLALKEQQSRYKVQFPLSR